MIKSSEYFIFDGQSSVDHGIMNVNIESGMLEEPFLSERNIIESKIRGRAKPYFQGVEQVPLTFDLSFAFEESWSEEKIRDISRWICVDSYRELKFSDNLNRIFYAMYVGSPILVHNGLSSGYVTLSFRCDGPFSYSPQYSSTEYDFSSNDVDGTEIDFVNNGDLECHPEVWITKVGNGNVSIVNATNGGQEFKFTSLLDTEELYIDCENEQIESILPDINGGDPLVQYRYDNFNDNYLEVVRGVNKLTVFGNCKIKFRYSFRTLQG